MGTTVIGAPDNSPFPVPLAASIIETRKSWSDDWKFNPELVLASCGLLASSSAVDTCEIWRKYGNVKDTFDGDYESREALDLEGTWIRLSLVSQDTGQPMAQFVGLVDNHTRILTGSDSQPAGEQRWVASGGLRMLRKRMVASSYFLDANGTDINNPGWIPAMNARDARGLLVGNRSDKPAPVPPNSPPGTEAIYYYGGKSVWTHLQYLKYLITNFIQQPDGPTWTLAGQTDVLDQMQTTIDFPQVTNVAEMLRHLVNVKYGLDYCVRPTDAGFEIHINALSNQDATIGGITMPKNPDLVQVQKTTDISLFETKIVESSERRVDAIEVMGARIVVCGTLAGSNAQHPAAGSLVPKWSPKLETDYISAGGTITSTSTTDAGDNDRIRRREKYRSVYRQLGAPSKWDLNKGQWCVLCDENGNLSSGESAEQKANNDEDDPDGDYQTQVRETLHWIPLKEGFDYSTDPPTDNTDGTVEPDVKPPMCWLYDETADTPQYVLGDQNGVHVHVPFQDWGAFLEANPNYLLAYNTWTTQNLINTGEGDPKYDYSKALATIAIRSDQRLRMAYFVPDDQKAGDGSVLTILDEEAECWVMLPGTIVDVDASGNLVGADTNGEFIILRNDINRIALVLAGAIARYGFERAKAQLTFKGLLPWGQLLGQILTVIQQGDDVSTIGAPITSIEWIINDKGALTIVKTGYA